MLEHKEAEALGNRLIKFLGLELKNDAGSDGVVNTDLGTKTPAGLARCVEQIWREGQVTKK